MERSARTKKKGVEMKRQSVKVAQLTGILLSAMHRLEASGIIDTKKMVLMR